jgi:predicted enzyme related to lactoylglutathione lyase
MEKKNPINWFEIAATDLERAKKFYESVFGVEFQLLEMPGMKIRFQFISLFLSILDVIRAVDKARP